jgi:DNA-binding transcriptional LysR family regulator
MDLRQLNYLVVTAEERSIRAAARRLHLSQPLVSRTLRELEAELGVRLFDRNHHGVELTTAGEELVAHAHEILDRLSAARAAVRRIGDQQSAMLHVGVVAGLVGAGELLVPILDAYRALRPDVHLDVNDLGMLDQVTPVLTGAVDVAIVRLPFDHADVVVTPIAAEPRVILTGTAHELAQEESVHIDEILEFPTLPLGSRQEWCDYWQLNYERGGTNCSPDVPPAETVGEAQLAIASHSVIVASAAAIGRLAPNPLVRAVPLRGVTPTIIAVAHKRRDTRRAVRDFVESAQAAAERHIDLLPDGILPDLA